MYVCIVHFPHIISADTDGRVGSRDEKERGVQDERTGVWPTFASLPRSEEETKQQGAHSQKYSLQ
jgi:hypothetical protein